MMVPTVASISLTVSFGERQAELTPFAITFLIVFILPWFLSFQGRHLSH
jgi:hypothetical protein